VIVTIVNKSVFDDDGSGWRRYSAFINLTDLTAIAYLFYFSPIGRNYIIGLMGRLKVEK
jgi:hypothetical protein